MIRFLFALMLLMHGLIHLMGFVKAFKLAEMSQLSSPISRPAGALWLLTALLFVFSTALFFLKKESWWMPAIPAVVLSQFLVFQYWQDAKFGTIANLIAVVGLVLGYGAWNFNTRIQRELSSFLQVATPAEEVLTHDMLAGLPPVVQRWLERSNTIGKPLARSVHLRQKGEMRTAPGGKWMSMDAEQYFTIHQPGFFWTADVEAAPYLHLTARDKYQEGKGHMLIKFLSLFPVADARGPEIDQGTLLRYLAEIIWFPSAALQPYLHWEPVDSLSARATMRYGEVEASGVFMFTPEGDMVSFDTRRYYDRKGGATLEKWHIQAEPAGFRDFEDIRVPARSTVTWQLDTGDFTWLRLEITDLEYNKVALHP